MRRINPATGLPFKQGDVRDDGRLFFSYLPTQIKSDGFFKEKWYTKESFIRAKNVIKKHHDNLMSTKNGHIKRTLINIRSKSKKLKIPFNLTLEYLISIAPNTCPVLGIELAWSERTMGKSKASSPSLDKIIPSLGYVVGNVQWLSKKANGMKQDASFQELEKFAKWVLKQSIT